MNTSMRIALAVLLSGVATQDAAAQWNNARLDGGRNRIYMTVGLDPAIVSTVGYARVIPVQGHDFQLATDVGLVTARLDTHDFRARVELQSPVVRWQSLQLSGAAAFVTRDPELEVDELVYGARGLALATARRGAEPPIVFRARGFAPSTADAYLDALVRVPPAAP